MSEPVPLPPPDYPGPTPDPEMARIAEEATSPVEPERAP